MKREIVLESLLALVAGFLLLFFVFKIPAFIISAFIFALIALLSKKLSELIAKAWTLISKALGSVMSKILLTIVFSWANIWLILPMK